MYGSRENEKKSEFVAKTKALRDQRAEEKSRERAAVKIQAVFRGYLCVRRLQEETRLEFDKFIAEASSKKPQASETFAIIRKFLFIFQDGRDDERFELLCRVLLGTMDHTQDEPKVWFVSVALNQKLTLLWISQLKKLLWICCRYVQKLKPYIADDAKRISIFLNMLIIFTDCGNWKLLTIKGGEALRPSLQQLCANVVGFLNTKGLYLVLKSALMNGLARSDPVLKPASITAIITLALRPMILANFSENFCSLFILNILSVPGVILHLTSVAPQCLKAFTSHGLLSKVLAFLADEQGSRIILNSLESGFTLSLIANLADLALQDEEVLKENSSKFVAILIKLLTYCQSYVAKQQSKLTNWHPIMGWFKQPSDKRLNESTAQLTKQLQLLWRRKMIGLLFTALPVISTNEDQEATQEDKGSKKPWSRLSRPRGRTTPALSVADKEATVSACVMYRIMLDLFSQIKLDILTGLSYQEAFMVRLWRFLQLFGSDDSPDSILGGLEKEGLYKSQGLLSTLTLVCDCCSHLIPIVDDSEMYEQQKPFKLRELVRMSAFLNSLVFKMLWHEMGDDNKPQEDPVRRLTNSAHTLLLILYDRDCRRAFTQPGHWLGKGVRMSTFMSELEKGKKGANLVLQRIPHVLPHRERVQLFRKFVQKDKESLGITRPTDHFVPHGTLISVRRPRILEDGYEQLASLPSRVFKGLIRVRFINEQGLPEAGIDQDGVFKEFLEEAIKRAFDPSLNLFKMTSGDEERLYPSTTSFIQDNHLSLFEFVGKMLGKALYEGIVVEVPFAPFFLNHVLGHQHSALYSSIDELPSLDQSLYKSLSFIKHFDGDARDLELSFSFDEDVLGKVTTHQLMPGGAAIHVTNENKISYVHLMAHYRMCVQIRDQTRAFIRGFNSIIRRDWLLMFSAPELQRLISGDNTPLDFSDLKRHTRYYGGYHGGHRVVMWLWDILEKDFTEKERSQFLKFVTSCSRPPLLGFTHLEPPFSIRCVESTEDEDEGDSLGSVIRGFFSVGRRRDPVNRLPTASTCFNLLKLPNYHRKSTLRDKLRYAINSNAGFELS